MTQNYSYKIRLYPTIKQKILLNKHFGCVRFIWNYFLDQKNKFYLENKEKDTKHYLTLNECGSKLVGMKKQEEYSWLKEVNSQSLQQTQLYLEGAFINFFKYKKRFPKFKKKNGKNSFTCLQGNKIKNNKLQIPKFLEGIKFKGHKNIKFDKICNVTISKTKTNKYFASVCVEKEVGQLPKNGSIIGIDLGVESFLVDSNGNKISSPNFYKQAESKLKKLHKQYSKKQGGSKNQEKARLKLAKCYEKITHQRKDFLHKLSTKLINENQVICLEDLNVKGMMQNHNLAKSIQDVSWSEFTHQLQYKASWYGREVVKIDRYFPSSKTCNKCGWIKNDLTLNDRNWVCPQCSFHLDRDLNAAKNILNQGLNLLDINKINIAGTAKIQASGELVPTYKSEDYKHIGSLKEEIHEKV